MQVAINFIKEAYAELQRVRFPSKQETIRLTVYVIGVSFATGLFVMLFDFIFKEVLEKVL